MLDGRMGGDGAEWFWGPCGGGVGVLSPLSHVPKLWLHCGSGGHSPGVSLWVGAWGWSPNGLWGHRGALGAHPAPCLGVWAGTCCCTWGLGGTCCHAWGSWAAVVGTLGVPKVLSVTVSGSAWTWVLPTLPVSPPWVQPHQGPSPAHGVPRAGDITPALSLGSVTAAAGGRVPRSSHLQGLRVAVAGGN